MCDRDPVEFVGLEGYTTSEFWGLVNTSGEVPRSSVETSDDRMFGRRASKRDCK